MNPLSSGLAGKSTASSIPSDSNVQAGIDKLNSYLRSIVITSTVFELFVGFNYETLNAGGWWGKLVRQKKDTKTDFRPQKKKDMNKKLLVEPARAKGSSSETILTSKMTERIASTQCVFAKTTAGSQGKEIAVMSEGQLEDAENTEERGQPPRLDISIGVKQRLLAFVEVGLTKNKCKGEENQSQIDHELDRLFWKKVDQSVNYLNVVRTTGVKDKARGREFHASETVLLCVLVLDRGRKRGRLAVFACEPRGKNGRATGSHPSFRMALLWRKEATLDQLDIAYARFIRAVGVMKTWECGPSKGSIWKYLGPNCSKVTIDEKSYVLRAYDTRVRATSRSPYLYNKMCKNETTPVLSIEDGGEGEILPFGKGASSDRFSMLFCDQSTNKRGKVEVIAVPFLEGSHICTHVDQAIAVLEMLQNMHKKGLVHGDIRGFNMVFAADHTKSALIDFDFGGKVGKAKYPPGYVRTLKDGDRSVRCKGGALIEKQDDVYAIFNVLFRKHTFPAAAFTPGMAKVYGELLSNQPKTVKDLLAGFSQLKDAGVVEMVADDDYRAYLDEATNLGDGGLYTPPGAQQSPPALVQNKKLHSGEGEGSKEDTTAGVKIEPATKKRGRAKEVASGSGKGAKRRKRSK